MSHTTPLDIPFDEEAESDIQRWEHEGGLLPHDPPDRNDAAGIPTEGEAISQV
jgi:hypothetical protein